MAAEAPTPQPPDDNDAVFRGENWLSAKIVEFIAAVTPKCTEVSRLLSEGMDHALPWWMRLKLRIHFLMCTYCKRYGEHLRILRNSGHHFCEHGEEVSREQMPPGTRERIKQVLRDAMTG